MDVHGERPRMRELDQRSVEGLTVTLSWSERTGSVYVSVEDRTTNRDFRLAVDPADALEAFRHPYGYRRRRGAAAPRAATWGAAAA
jgi:hypothetical protein